MTNTVARFICIATVLCGKCLMHFKKTPITEAWLKACVQAIHSLSGFVRDSRALALF